MLLMLRMMRDRKRARSLAKVKVRARLLYGRPLVRRASAGCAEDEEDTEKRSSLLRWSVILGSSALALHMIMKGGEAVRPGNLRLRSLSHG